MLSKNNYQERLRKITPKKERFSIRKISVGTASVLIGFSLLGLGNQKVKAATSEKEGAPQGTSQDKASDNLNSPDSKITVVEKDLGG